MPIMERYLYASGSQPPLDSGGLLSSSVFGLWSDFTSISLSEASKIPCGILVAEGGMGKTVFMDQLANLSPDQTVLLKVEEYQSDISAFATALKTAEKTILVDGLDENPEATTGLILRFLRDASGAKFGLPPVMLLQSASYSQNSTTYPSTIWPPCHVTTCAVMVGKGFWMP